MAIKNISKNKYHATAITRAVKSIQKASINGLPAGAVVLTSVLEWRLISEQELAASESANGTLVSQGTTEWVIKKRSIAAGIYQVRFNALFTIGDPASPLTLKAFNYGFIKVVTAHVRAIIDGGTSALWGSTENVTVDGSLSYDADIGPGNHTGLIFSWSCRKSDENGSLDNTCFGAFTFGRSATAVDINPGALTNGKTYVLRLTVSKDKRSSFAEMSFEIAGSEIPQVTLR